MTTVEEANELKLRLEADLLHLLFEFEKESQCKISEINLTRVLTITGEKFLIGLRTVVELK